jgi:hypothetical protein
MDIQKADFRQGGDSKQRSTADITFNTLADQGSNYMRMEQREGKGQLEEMRSESQLWGPCGK